MKNAPLYRRILSVVLTIAMLATLLVPVVSAEPDKAAEDKVIELTLTPIDASTLESQKTNLVSEDATVPMEEHALTDVVRVSIELDKPSTIGAGYSMDGIANNAEAMNYRAGLKADQAALTSKIEAAIGSKLDVKWNLTLAANMISANIAYGQIDTVKAIPGVKNVFMENRYEPQVAEHGGDEPENGSASYMIGSNLAWADGYTGAGSKVAVIDTGADSEHQSFSGEGLEYALAQNAEEKGMSYDEYVATLNLLTPETIEAVKDQLNANIGSGEAAYRNTKIGYGYNYVDKVVNYIEHINDSQGEHGSHVSGIATANRFIKVDGEYKPALEAVGTQGVAPDAQLVVMKVFGKGGGAYDSDYMVAIEDAIILGCDSANLSLGSGAPGFGFSNGYEDVMNELVENGLVVAFSAGNSGMWYDTPNNPNMAYPYLYIDDNNYATGGSPGSFTNTLGTASVNNGGQTGFPLVFGDLHVFYSETSGYGNSPISTLAGSEYEYVLLDNPGVADNDLVGSEDGDYFLQVGSEVLTGKIAMCYRGSSSFFAKANAAMAQGAIGIVIINNTSGVINMNLTGYNYTAPAVSILKADGDAIKANSEKVTLDNGAEYYTGTMSVAAELEVQVPEISDTVEVSSFSSYGTPGTMVLKPEILTPGGSIYSVNGLNNGGGGHDAYEVMSGTSMASPQTAGMAAVLGQYIRDNDLCEKTGLTQRQLINSLLMSTAHPVYDSYGDYWPVFRVGAGLANVSDAINAKSYILMDETATLFPDSARDGKVKVELGDDPDHTGVYDYTFTINPIDEGGEYTFRTDIFTQWIAGNGGYGMLQDTGTTLVGSEVTYEVNGEVYEDTYQIEADVNMDGVTDDADAQAILDYVTGELDEDADFDAEAADLDGDDKITTFDAHLILEAAATPTVEVNGPTEVKVHIEVDPADLAFLLRYFTNGFYIEGYTYIEPVADEEGAMDVVHSIPIFGYFGSWTDANMLDRTSAIDEAYGTGKEPYVGNKNINYLTMKDAAGETMIYMGNPYVIEDEFPADRLAMNSASTIQSFTYLNIRNAATLGFAVTDEDGKVLYAQATPTWKYSAYYYVNGGSWQNTNPATYNVGKALSAAGVAEGDKVTVGFYALPEYYGIVNAKLNDEVATSGSLDTAGFTNVLESGVVGEHAGIKYDVTIDDTAPTVIGALQDLISGDIYVKCSDNNYVAYVAITNKSGSQVYFATVPEQNGPGEELEVPLELEGVNLPNEVVLLVGDYAGNEAAFKVSLGGSGSAEDPNAGLMLGFVTDKTTAAPGEGNRMWEIDKDALWYNYSAGTYEGLNVYSKVDFAVRAAEYVDGYVFMACTDGWIRVAELAAMDEAMLVGKFDETVEEIYDMAFNYRDKTLYVLDNKNTVYSMDLITGELTPVAVIILDGVTGSYSFLNKMAIDDDGTFWVGNYGSPSYNAGLSKFKLPEPVEEEGPSELGELVYGFGFEGDVEEEGWQFIDNDGDGYNWEVDTTSPQEGTYCIKSASYQGGTALSPDNWAVSPAIDLTGLESATVSVWLKNYMSAFPETFGIFAGTTDDVTEMTQVGEDIVPGTAWEQDLFDLSEFAGEEEVYVAIRHYNSYDEFRGYADLFEVYGIAAEEPVEEPEVEIPEITATRVGDLGAYNYSNGGAFAWDHNEGVLYMASNYNATQDYDHYLWVINTSTGKATRANETQGTGNTSSNASARLYGCVNGLFIVPTEQSLIEPVEEATDLIVEPEEITLFKGMSADLTVAVLPWTLVDKDVTFEIADETVATINDKGTVTGVEVGTTTVTVTTVAEPNLTAEVTVNVIVPPEAELRGIIWDENGKGQASVFNTNDTANWEALGVVGQLRWGSLVDDKVYGSTEDTMYVFDADTYEVETLGGIVSDWIPSDADALPEDMADAYGALVSSGHVGQVLGICLNGTYLEMLDPELGNLVYFDLSDDFGSDPMALISFVGRMDYEGNSNCAVYFVMTESGKLYLFILTMDGSLYMEEYAQTALDMTGVADVTNEVWASMFYDEENEFIYVAKFDGTDDYAYLYAIDANDPSCVGVTGNFNENVWPVVGLYKYTPATDLSMTVKPTDVVLYVGETAEISIKIKLGETNEYEAEVADPTICSFEDGIVTGLKEGETDITITTVDANEAGEHLSETVHVKVKDLAALDLVVKGQVTDAKGARFTNILLDGPTAASSSKPAPGDVFSGARGGDIYLAGVGSTAHILDAETFEATDAWNGVDSYFATYPPLDLANYPNHIDSTGAVDNHKFLMTTELGWLVYPDYYGWNLSSYIPDMAAIAFAGTDEDSDGTPVYVYYIMTTSGVLYQIPVQYEAGSLGLNEMMETGITVTDPTALSMAFVVDANIHGDGEEDYTYGLVVANNEDQSLYFIDFQEEAAEDVVKRIGSLDATNVSGLIGSFDDLKTVTETEPVEPEPEISGDVVEGFYFETEDDFNAWTLVDADGDGYNWTWNFNCGDWFSGTPDFSSWAYEGTGCAVSASFINTVGVLTPDNWMVIGPVDLSEAADDAVVSLYAKGLDASYAAEPFAVYAGTSDDVDDMVMIGTVNVATAEYTQYFASLADFVGEEEVYIAVRHWDISDMYILLVDQVEILDNLTAEIPEPPEPISGETAYAWDFETDPTSDGWTFVDSDNDGYNWYWHVNTGTGNHTTHSGDGIIASESYNNDTGAALNPDNWAISPALDLSDATAAAVSIWAMGQDPSYASEKFQLYAGTSADIDDMEAISNVFTATGSYVNYTGDLTDYLGEEEVYVAIRHYNVSDMFILNVDDVEILVEGADDGDSLKDAPHMTYEAMPMSINANVLGDGVAMMNASATYAFTATAELAKFGEATNEVVGGTNAVKVNTRTGLKMPVDETVVEDNAVNIVLTDDEAATNGLYTVTFDAEKLTFVNAESDLDMTSIHVEDGVITFAFASLEEIPAETELVTLNFTFEGEEIETEVTVQALERGDDVAVEEDALVIPIVVEKPVCEHEYGEPEWTWAEDFSTATAKFVCALCGDEQTLDAVVTFEVLEDKTVYTATVEFNGETYTDVQEGPAPQIFTLIDVVKDGDLVVIYNPAAGMAVSNADLSEAQPKYRAGVAVTPEDDKIVTSDASIIWTVQATEEGVKFVDAEGHVLSMETSGLELDKTNDLWEIRSRNEEDFTVNIVNVNAPAGSSGDPKALEWYERYSEFSTHYLNADDGQFIFELYAISEGGEPPVHECAIAHFEDVMEAYPYGTPEHEAIEWAFTADPQITAGMDDTHFGVGKTLTRAQAATFLYAAAGKPEFDPTTAEVTFTDVPQGKWYTTAVLWAASEGLVAGYADGTFLPNGTLTRGQIMVILYAKEGKPSVEGLENPYSDVAAGKWFTDSAIWAYHAGIEQGEDGVYAQSTPCTREAFVLYLYREMTGNCLLGE